MDNFIEVLRQWYDIPSKMTIHMKRFIVSRLSDMKDELEFDDEYFSFEDVVEILISEVLGNGPSFRKEFMNELLESDDSLRVYIKND